MNDVNPNPKPKITKVYARRPQSSMTPGNTIGCAPPDQNQEKGDHNQLCLVAVVGKG